LIGLGLGGLLELLFHWLEGGSEHGCGQLGNVPAITDSGFNPFLDQTLLQFEELRQPGREPFLCFAIPRWIDLSFQIQLIFQRLNKKITHLAIPAILVSY
jgi:hypothetical protein